MWRLSCVDSAVEVSEPLGGVRPKGTRQRRSRQRRKELRLRIGRCARSGWKCVPPSFPQMREWSRWPWWWSSRRRTLPGAHSPRKHKCASNASVEIGGSTEWRSSILRREVRAQPARGPRTIATIQGQQWSNDRNDALTSRKLSPKRSARVTSHWCLPSGPPVTPVASINFVTTTTSCSKTTMTHPRLGLQRMLWQEPIEGFCEKAFPGKAVDRTHHCDGTGHYPLISWLAARRRKSEQTYGHPKSISGSEKAWCTFSPSRI